MIHKEKGMQMHIRGVGIALTAVAAILLWASFATGATTQPTLVRRYTIGKGDTGSAAGVGNSVRMDFQTIAILPDGRLAVSFLDSTTHYPSPTTGAEQTRPALAIELTTTPTR